LTSSREEKGEGNERHDGHECQRHMSPRRHFAKLDFAEVVSRYEPCP
jgi:hypothetical protein